MMVGMRKLLFLLVAAGLLAAGCALGASVQPSQPNPEKVRALTELLRDPGIQAWLKAQADGAPASTERPQGASDANSQEMMAARLDATREFLRDLAVAIPTLPAELRRAWATFASEFRERGPPGVLLLLGAFAVLGFGLEWLFRRVTTGFRQRIAATSLDTVHDRLQVLWMRTAHGVGELLAFALGSIGAFLLFDWPLVLRQVVVVYLIVFLVIRLTRVLGGIILSPDAERFRIVPITNASARFWHVWSAVLFGYYFFVKVTLGLLATLGVGRAADYLVGLACGVVLLGLALFVLWRHPTSDGRVREHHRHRLGSWLLSLYLVIVWLLLFTGSATPFYIGIILLLLPIAIRVNRLAVNHLLRPTASGSVAHAMPSLAGASLERALRVALLIGGAFLIIWILELDVGALMQRDSMLTHVLRGGLNAAVIVLLADFAWVVMKAVIDLKLAGAQSTGPSDSDEARRAARLRTLLPILRNVLFIVLAAMTILMALSALGIEIGPLIAGAGVVGVAIGFGAQTLVRDIISGVFFLLDDAFRVGEYIQSGNYKGTVESFSIRSVKLRHHRGPLYTVPFGALGAIQNMSRDWVIDKLGVGVTYDTDLDKVKKIIKQIGKDLTNDPELAPHIIETLKMQGVEQFGDFAIQVRMKLMTKPGEQFVVRRRALALIKKAFDANGIKFAYPTVQVAGGEQTSGAAAQHVLELVKPQPPAA
jgi:moderate conductance mechanosensitive channel